MAEGTPTDYVLSMRAQGISNNHIIQSLQRANYHPQQIADAMSQADIKYNVESFPMKAQEAAAYSSAGDEEMQGSYAYPSEDSSETQPITASEGTAAAMQEAGFSVEALQQLIEQIIEEKWEDLIKNVSRIAEWKEKTETKIALIEQQMSDLKSSFDKLHSAIIEKIGDYDQTMKEVGTDIKALEQVFKKTLPGFMENVAELSRITDQMKKK